MLYIAIGLLWVVAIGFLLWTAYVNDRNNRTW